MTPRSVPLLTLALLLAAPALHAQADEGAGPRASASAGLGTHQTHWRAELGTRVTFVKHAGYDPFSTNDALTQVSLGGARTLWASGPLSYAVSFHWDYGEAHATARGEATQLYAHRIAPGAEARWHFLPQLYAYGRVAPGLMSIRSELQSTPAGGTLETRGPAGWSPLDVPWVPTLDLLVGAAVEALGNRSGSSRDVRLWLLAEGGYGWAGATDLQLQGEGDALPQRVAALDLGELALRGATFRISAAATF